MKSIMRLSVPGLVLASALVLVLVMPGCNQTAGGTGANPVYRDAPPERPGLQAAVFNSIVAEDEAGAIELVNQGAPVNGRNERGISVLHFAARATMPDLTRVLLEYGADVNATIERGIQPIHWAARAGASDRPGSEETIDVLLQYGADINARTEGDQRPIDYAILLNNTRWKEFLVSRGAQP